MQRLLTYSVSMALMLWVATIAPASNHYTTKQLDALAERVGNEYWIHVAAGRVPVFYTKPAPNAVTFRPSDNDSFEITEMVGRESKTPYYKVRFQSGTIAFLRPETFNEELNGTILVSDPLAAEKRNAEESAALEKQRIGWINAQAWPPAVKEAAIKKQPTAGLTTDEIRQVMGAPRRITKTGGQFKGRNPLEVHVERWYYADGTILLFRNNILSQVDHRPAK